MTAHAADEMAEDGLDIIDIETSILNSQVVKTEKEDTRGTRYTVQGYSADGVTPRRYRWALYAERHLPYHHSVRGHGARNMNQRFGYKCEYCEGTVRAKRVEREAFKHKHGFVILEDVPIGVCDKCGNRYYAAATLRRVHAVATGKERATRTEPVPVAHFS